ncbi:MAG: hypothetical protein AAFR27_10560 [Pseudomonadota bacterium]
MSSIPDYLRAGGVALFTAFGLFLVGYKILEDVEIPCPAWFCGTGQATSPSPDKDNEIREYSEFITIKRSDLDIHVITGIRYGNSRSQNIVAQWCYAVPAKTSKDGLSLKLSLREFDNGKPTDFAPFSAQTLAKMRLTQAQASGLLKDCRFR